MMNWYGGWGVGGWFLMSLIMLAVVALIVVGVVALTRRSNRRRDRRRRIPTASRAAQPPDNPHRKPQIRRANYVLPIRDMRRVQCNLKSANSQEPPRNIGRHHRTHRGCPILCSTPLSPMTSDLHRR